MPFYTLISFGSQAFNSLILFISAFITAQFAFGYGTRTAREMFIVLILLLMLGVQFYYLIKAANFVPATRFFVLNEKLHRSDCLESTKGGKRPIAATEFYDKNPCFCHTGSVCVDPDTGKMFDVDANHSCLAPFGCLSNGTVIDQYIPFFRNCVGGQASYCTLDEPCDPCDRETLHIWGSGRCRTCSSGYRGDCNFIQGVGPYCYVEKGSKRVRPCKRCCTEPEPFYFNGTCY